MLVFTGSTTSTFNYTLVKDSIKLIPIGDNSTNPTTYFFRCVNEQIDMHGMGIIPSGTYHRCN